ncbi:MAG TPA: translocation/assembly module TamB domain-containing protein [Gammaproteobacteria bacterium]
MTARKRHPLLRKTLLAVAAIVILLAGLLTAAFYSTAAFRFALETAQPFIPGELRYESINGTLAGPVRAGNITYEHRTITISAASLEFDISPWALLAGNVNLDYLNATRLVVTLPPPDEPAGDEPRMQPHDILDALALPVEIGIGSLAVDGFALHGAGGETLLQLKTLRAALDWSADRLAITALDAEGPRIETSGDAVLGLAGENASRLDLDIAWRGGAFPVAATVRGDGSAQRLDLTVQMHEPAQATLIAQLHDLLDAPDWNGTLNVADLRPSAFGDALPNVAWSGEFRFDGDAEDTRVEGTARGGWPPATGVRLALDAVVNAERVRVKNLSATIDAFDAEISAQGELRYADALAWSASGNVAQVAWPEMKTLSVRDARFAVNGDADGLELQLDAAAGDNGRLAVDGELSFAQTRFAATLNASDLAFAFNGTSVEVAELSGTATGAPEDYSASLQGTTRINQLPPAHFDIKANGDPDQLVAAIETLQWLDGSARGRAALAWGNELKLDVHLNGSGFELDRIDPRVTGRVGGDVYAQASFGGGNTDIALRVASLDGDIAGQPLSGSGAIRFANGKLTTRGMTIDAGDAHLELEDAASGFGFLVDIPALGALHSDLDGQLQAKGHFNGELASPTLHIQASGGGVYWQEWQAGTFELDAGIIDGGRRDSAARLEANEIETPFVRADALILDLRGDLDEHRLQFDASGGDGNVHFAVQGGLEDAAWSGDIDELRIEHPAAGTWQLAEPDATKVLRFSANTLRVPEHCLLSSTGRACFGVESAAQDWSLQGSLQAVPVNVIAGILPPGLEYDGAISGNLRMNSTPQGIRGDAAFQLSAGGIRQAAGAGAESLLGWTSGRAGIHFDGKRATAELDIGLLDGGEITGSGTLNLPAAGAATIDASLRASIGNLQLLPSLIPELSRMQGRVTARLDIDGRLDEPGIRGEVKLRDGQARILALGTDWENVTLDLAAVGREISMTGHAESGDGHMDIELRAHDAGEGFRGKARLTGENFKAVHTPEANVDISPQLALTLRGNDLYIDGEVFVPFARIEPRDLSTAVQPSPDQVIVNAEKTTDDGLQVNVAVTTKLGDDVRVNALGLKARMEGELTVSKQPGNPAIGNGRLVVAEGEYKAYGQDLTLAKGEIIYTGQPLANPGLDIRAERKPQPEITVGVAVRGPLSQPTATVYSDPPMSQTEALAWLLFGRSVEQVTGEEEGQISEAAIALGLGGQRLLGSVGRKLGVEEIRVEDVSDRERASLVLGKYLSPDLYVSYGIGLFEAVNSFRIRYRISSKWTLEATSGLKSSADFLYTIER